MVHTAIDALAGRSEQSVVEPGKEVPLRPTHTASNPYSPTLNSEGLDKNNTPRFEEWSSSSTIGQGLLKRHCRVGDQASGQERHASIWRCCGVHHRTGRKSSCGNGQSCNKNRTRNSVTSIALFTTCSTVSPTRRQPISLRTAYTPYININVI